MLGLSIETVRQMAADGRLPAVRLTRKLQFREDSVDRAVLAAERRAARPAEV